MCKQWEDLETALWAGRGGGNDTWLEDKQNNIVLKLSLWTYSKSLEKNHTKKTYTTQTHNGSLMDLPRSFLLPIIIHGRLNIHT